MIKRPDWDAHWMGQAEIVARRGTCLRRNFGAIIVSSKNIQISQGYNGAPRGTPNCSDLGKCRREELKVPSGERYELCRSVHAEQNAIINAAKSGVRIPEGSKIYVYSYNVIDGSKAGGSPCSMCERAIMNAEIAEVYCISKDEGKIAKSLVSDWQKQQRENPLSDFRNY